VRGKSAAHRLTAVSRGRQQEGQEVKQECIVARLLDALRRLLLVVLGIETAFQTHTNKRLYDAVLAACGWPSDRSDEEILARLLALNLERSTAVYYLLTLLLQVTPYSLAIGAGVNVGVALFRPPQHYQTEKWLGLFPKEVLWDLGRIDLIVIPLFLVASLWEFLSPWNI
jgi:hypothetical protein